MSDGHLPRALEMANARARRWMTRYNNALASVVELEAKLDKAHDQLREAKAEAWDEGWEARDAQAWQTLNPYRGGEVSEHSAALLARYRELQNLEGLTVESESRIAREQGRVYREYVQACEREGIKPEGKDRKDWRW